MSEERLAFQAEVSRLLKLMVNSVYSDKEVFLRELIILDSRQHEIEDDQIEATGLRLFISADPVRRRAHLAAEIAQVQTEQFSDIPVVFDDQDAACHDGTLLS